MLSPRKKDKVSVGDTYMKIRESATHPAVLYRPPPEGFKGAISTEPTHAEIAKEKREHPQLTWKEARQIAIDHMKGASRLDSHASRGEAETILSRAVGNKTTIFGISQKIATPNVKFIRFQGSRALECSEHHVFVRGDRIIQKDGIPYCPNCGNQLKPWKL